ncbi:hypothetical protein COOONC_26880 [Cooperia oncophora]
MGTSSRRSKKRRGDDEDSDDGRRNRDRNHSSSRSRSPSPKPKKSRRREKEKESSPPPKEEFAESLSIEETNKLRAKLGLAPLEINDGPKAYQCFRTVRQRAIAGFVHEKLKMVQQFMLKMASSFGIKSQKTGVIRRRNRR